MVTAWRRAALATGLLAATGLLGSAAIHSAPPGSTSLGLWPSALLTAALGFVPHRLRLTVAALGATLAIGCIAVAGRPTELAVVLGVGLALQSLVTRALLPGDSASPGRPALCGIPDVARLLRACVAGAAVLGVAGALAGILTGAQPVVLALAVGTSSLAGQFSLLPFFCRMRPYPGAAGNVERGIQGAALVAVASAVFVPVHVPTPSLVIFPVLAWGCLRSSAHDALVKMLALQLYVGVLTSLGRGPLARPDLVYSVSPDTQTMLLATFVTVTAVQVIVLCATVGEQAESKRAIAAERDRIRSIVQSITSVAVITSDPRGIVTLFNPGAERLLGWPAHEVLGRSSRMLHSAEALAAKAATLGLPADHATVAKALMDGGPTEMGFLRRNGQERVHLMSLNRVRDDQGVVTGHVSVSEDITELIEARSSLVAALEAERTAGEKLRELDRIKDAFVSSVSHELRTPLTSIVGYAELLQDGACGELPPEQANVIDRIRANCGRLITLISDLLDLGRLHEAATGEPELVDLVEAVRTGVAVGAPTAASRGVAIHLDLPEGARPVLGEREHLERLVINLVGNAIKFTEPGGRVHVRLEDDPCGDSDGRVVLEVADTGIGVPLTEQSRLFDRFFRSSLAVQGAVPGSGLGLSIARAIVEQHGGRITFTSRPGVGTTFRVHLPVARAGRRGPERADPPEELGRAGDETGRADQIETVTSATEPTWART